MEEYQVDCLFCGNKHLVQLPDDYQWRAFNRCNKCSISTKLAPFSNVLYAGFGRHMDYKVADRYLERDKIVVLKKVKQWHHGCYATIGPIQGTFDYSLFCPPNFNLATRIYPSIEEMLTPGFVPPENWNKWEDWVKRVEKRR